MDSEENGLLFGRERHELCYCDDCLEATGLSVLQLEVMFATSGQCPVHSDSSNDHCDLMDGQSDHNDHNNDGQEDNEDDC